MHRVIAAFSRCHTADSVATKRLLHTMGHLTTATLKPTKILERTLVIFVRQVVDLVMTGEELAAWVRTG